MGISKTMRNYCGEIKNDELLNIGLELLTEYEDRIVPETYAYNPHELVRLLEVFDILTVSRIILNACLSRRSNSKPLRFMKNNYSGPKTEDSEMLITLKQSDSRIVINKLPFDFYGDLKENYEKYNKEYLAGK
jgi:succinate dehydrogenase/fumarate reductase flavoprotein subunit